MGALVALTGLLHRTTRGGSWHGKVSLLQYDMLLFRVGLHSPEIQDQLRQLMGSELLAMNHSNSVDQISGAALREMRLQFPAFFARPNLTQRWYAAKYNADIEAVSPVAEIQDMDVGFERASRPNGSDAATWDFGQEDDVQRNP